MVHKCVIRDCNSEWYPGCNLKFHSFPKDLRRRKKWLSRVPLKTKMYEGAKICSLHFNEVDYTGHRLHKNAEPFFIKNSDSPEMLEEISSTPSSSSCSPVSHEQVNDEKTPPIVKPIMCDMKIQAKLITEREKNLKHKNKMLDQKLKRQDKYIRKIKDLLAIVKDYTAQSEMENIIKGNFLHIRSLLNKKTFPPHTRFCKEVKTFALTLYIYSPKAYNFLKKYVALPHPETLRRSIASCGEGQEIDLGCQSELETHQGEEVDLGCHSELQTPQGEEMDLGCHSELESPEEEEIDLGSHSELESLEDQESDLGSHSGLESPEAQEIYLEIPSGLDSPE